MQNPATVDIDPQETQEWLEAMGSLIRQEGIDRARFMLDQLTKKAIDAGCRLDMHRTTAYTNTISVQEEPAMRGDAELEQRIRALIRWNAMAMVVRAQKVDSTLGGHIGTFASSATLYDVGFNHFWRGPEHPSGGDLIYIQGHASPGVYSRLFLQGDLTEEQLVHFRREVDKKGLSSYPHPWLM
ncbi:MAG TPA: pyruvate dehydrogenase (acetyl-transferring), homodimeric type, partial [Candidatus Berkiella sp.]|nr:pyruvate dehydrogenase (acetyl-transferring), homodimeric type [Candidatus Berkiella sp.]